jgi:hypothetical protein
MQVYAIERLVERGRRLQSWSENAMEKLGNKLDLPGDICDWVTPGALVSWVQQEVAAPQQEQLPEPGSLILAVLAFAYCRGIFDSEEILRACDSVSEFQRLSKDAVSGTDQLRDVRHRTSIVLIRLLARLLTRAVSEKCALPPAEFPRSLKDRVHADAVQRLQNAVLIDHVS